MRLSLGVAISAVVTGTLAAVWLVRRAGRIGAATLTGVLLSALTVPWLVLGVAMLLVVNAIGLGRSMFSIYLGLTAITMPYVTFLVVEPDARASTRTSSRRRARSARARSRRSCA